MRALATRNVEAMAAEYAPCSFTSAYQAHSSGSGSGHSIYRLGDR